MVVDLSGLTQIGVSNSGLATIHTGNRVGDIATALNDKGRALPHGICPYLGIGGHACMLTFLSDNDPLLFIAPSFWRLGDHLAYVGTYP